MSRFYNQNNNALIAFFQQFALSKVPG